MTDPVYDRPTVNSPFIEGSTMQTAWDSTSLKWLQQCPKLYEYQMIQGYFPKGDNPHLTFGLVFHSALEVFDKAIAAGVEREEAVQSCVRHALEKTGTYIQPGADAVDQSVKWRPWASDHNLKNRENLIRTIVWYTEHYREDPAVVMILRDGKPAVELSFRFAIDMVASNGEPFLLCGHLDKVVEFAGAGYVMDKKTSGHPITDNFFAGFDLDTQMSLYTVAGKTTMALPLKGVIIDGVQVAVGFSAFLRGFTYRLEENLEEFLSDIKHFISQAEGYAAANYYPRNTNSCNFYMDAKGFGGCPFKAVCKRHPSQRDSVLKTDFTRRRWNPLEPR